MAREVGTALIGLREVLVPLVRAMESQQARWHAALEPLRQVVQQMESERARLRTVLAPFAQEIERGRIAENLLKQGWVPNFATPFDMVDECGDDGATLRTSLLDYYTINWDAVRTQLESRLSSYIIDDEAKATFREALDAHEAGFYRAVSRLLFPEFERVFRAALFDGHAGQIPYGNFMETLFSDEEADNLGLGDFLIAGFQDIVLFKYVTESIRKPRTTSDDPSGAASEYVPGLAVHVDKTNIALARQSPIPTRHAVVHGLVTYSSKQSSLNAIFIADYVFSILSVDQRHRLERRDSDTGSKVVEVAPTAPRRPAPARHRSP